MAFTPFWLGTIELYQPKHLKYLTKYLKFIISFKCRIIIDSQVLKKILFFSTNHNNNIIYLFSIYVNIYFCHPEKFQRKFLYYTHGVLNNVNQLTQKIFKVNLIILKNLQQQ